jgi:hypothetical protein
MSIFLFTNNAVSKLAAPITNTATTMTVTAGTGSLFPNPGPSQQFALTLVDSATGLNKEVVYCTQRVGDTLTILRAQEPVAGGQTAYAYALYDICAHLFTAGVQGAMQQSATFLGQYQVPFFNAYGSFPASSVLVGDTPTTQFTTATNQTGVSFGFQVSTATNLSNPIKLQIAYTGDVMGNQYCVQFGYQNASGSNLSAPAYTTTIDELPGPTAANTEMYYQTVTAIIPAAALTSQGWFNCTFVRLPGNVNDTNTGNLRIINITLGQ